MLFGGWPREAHMRNARPAAIANGWQNLAVLNPMALNALRIF
jgi:hypothetical protein